MNLVVDIQCFKRENNKFIVKELAAYNGEQLFHCVFRPPFALSTLSPDLQKQAQWLTKNHHCIEWTSGSIPHYMFSKVIEDMTKHVDRIYVKGREKATYLQQFISQPIIELDEEPAISQGSPKCLYHTKSHCICALSNVFNLYETFIMS